MVLGIDLILYIAAFILFLLDGFRVQAPVHFTSIAFACLVLSLIL
jgi:hypothetical protein